MNECENEAEVCESGFCLVCGLPYVGRGGFFEILGGWGSAPPPPCGVRCMQGTVYSVPSFCQLAVGTHLLVFAAMHQVGGAVSDFGSGQRTGIEYDFDAGWEDIRTKCASGTLAVGTLHQWLGKWVRGSVDSPLPTPHPPLVRVGQLWVLGSPKILGGGVCQLPPPSCG